MSDSEVKIRFPADASNATRAVQGATTATHGLAGAMNGARDAINGASRAIGLFRRALGVIGWISSIVGMLISAWQALPEKTQRAREGGKGRQRGLSPFSGGPDKRGPPDHVQNTKGVCPLFPFSFSGEVQTTRRRKGAFSIWAAMDMLRAKVAQRRARRPQAALANPGGRTFANAARTMGCRK